MARDVTKDVTRNILDISRKITEDDIMMERIKKAKKEIEEDETSFIRISSRTSAKEMVYYFSNMLEKMGIEIKLNHEEVPFLPSANEDIMNIGIRRISDQNLRRMINIKHAESSASKETISLEEHEKQIESLKEQLREARAESTYDKDAFEKPRRLIKNAMGKLEWTEGKSLEERKEKKKDKPINKALSLFSKKSNIEQAAHQEVEQPKDKDYEKKIKWFCEKYEEDYDVIYESFKDDNLENIMWKGERVEFPSV